MSNEKLIEALYLEYNTPADKARLDEMGRKDPAGLLNFAESNYKKREQEREAAAEQKALREKQKKVDYAKAAELRDKTFGSKPSETLDKDFVS